MDSLAASATLTWQGSHGKIEGASSALSVETSTQSELDFARTCLASAPTSTSNIVRRYREQPSPLVRDSVAVPSSVAAPPA